MYITKSTRYADRILISNKWYFVNGKLIFPVMNHSPQSLVGDIGLSFFFLNQD